MSDLYEEATMSIEELIMRYGKRIRENSEDNEGESKASSLDLLSKVCAKGRKSKRCSEPSAEKTEHSSVKEEGGNDCTIETDAPKEDELNTEKESPEKKTLATETATVAVASENQVPEIANELNGKLHNGSDNHENDHSKSNDTPVSVKGKGVGKGLSNSIRKTVEKSLEEIEVERREAEKLAKRQERKKSLRSKSADELYK